MIIDAKDAILGRLATFVAKKALMGEKIDIINSEKAVVSGRQAQVFSVYDRKIKRGIPLQGPYFPRQPDKIVRRTVRGMLPYKTDRGRNAFASVKCWVGIPEELKGQKPVEVKGVHASKLPYLKYTALGRISKLLGSK